MYYLALITKIKFLQNINFFASLCLYVISFLKLLEIFDL